MSSMISWLRLSPQLTPNIWPQPIKLFFIASLGYIGFLLSYNIKSYLLVIILFSLFCFFFLSLDLPQVLFLTYLFTLFSEKGLRDFHLPVVLPGIEVWETSYSLYFGASVKIFISLALILILIFKPKIRHQSLPRLTQLGGWLLISLCLLILLSSLFSPFANLSFLGLIHLYSAISGFFFVVYFTRFYPNLRSLIPSIFIALTLFISLIGLSQTLKHGTLGLFIEDTNLGNFTGFTTKESINLYRVAGPFGHPTIMGVILSMLLPLLIGLSLSSRLPLHRFALITTIICLPPLIATLSRSAWFCLLIILLSFYYLSRRVLGQIRLPLKIIFISLGFTLLLLSPLLIIRWQSFTDLWTTGNLSGRYNLTLQALHTIKETPIWGTGLNLFTLSMSQRSLDPAVRQFLLPVHNTLLLLTAEIGLPSGVILFVLSLYLLIKSFPLARQNFVSFGYWLGAVAFAINSLFHPLLTQDPSLGFFMIYLGLLTTL